MTLVSAEARTQMAGGRNKHHQFRCKLCGQFFKSFYFLQIHRRNHTGEDPLKCSICVKTFTFPSSLKRHLRMHTGEAGFKCHACGKAFSRKDYLATHIFKAHPESFTKKVINTLPRSYNP